MKLFVICSVLLSATQVFAQTIETGTEQPVVPENNKPDEDTKYRRSGGAGYYAMGLVYPRVSDINGVLSANGLPEVSGVGFFQGGGGHSWIGDLMIGGFGGSMNGGGSTVAGQVSSIGGGFGMFQLGYDLLPQKTLSLYPILGIGGGGMGIEIAPTQSETIDEVLVSTQHRSEIGTGGWLAMAGVGFDYTFGPYKQLEESNAIGGFNMGIRAGYMFALPINDSWKLNGSNTTMSFGGPTIMLTMGGAGAEWKPKR